MDVHAAAEQIRSVDEMALGLGPGIPGGLLEALGERDDFTDLHVFCALLTGWYPLFTKPGVKLLSGFYGPIERVLLGQGKDVEFVPSDFRGFARVAEERPFRVMATAVAPPDENGFCSLSLHAGATVHALQRACESPDQLVIAEINRQLPRTMGLPPEHPHALHVDAIDVVYEVDRPIFALQEGDPSPVEIAIAEHASAFIHDGCTLQTGIGGIPNAVMKQLAAGDGGDYGVHSEMFTTGLMKLHQAGKVTNQKGIYDGFSPATFAAGTQELYEWLDGNDLVRFLPVDLVNDPSIIARNRDFVSINGALSVDLQGQLVADSIAGDQFSGIGGHEDFVAGAAAHTSDRSLICLPSTAGKGDARISRITAKHPAGTLVTTPRHLTDVVITEYGAAELHAKTVRERAEALAAIAHPAVRDALLAGEDELPPIPAED